MEPKTKISLSRETFLEILDTIEKQYEHDQKYNICLSSLVGTEIDYYKNHWLFNQLIIILQIAFPPIGSNCDIEYFMNILNFGKKYQPGMVKDDFGNDIDFSSASKLYDHLISRNV